MSCFQNILFESYQKCPIYVINGGEWRNDAPICALKGAARSRGYPCVPVAGHRVLRLHANPTAMRPIPPEPSATKQCPNYLKFALTN